MSRFGASRPGGALPARHIIAAVVRRQLARSPVGSAVDIGQLGRGAAARDGEKDIGRPTVSESKLPA
jgi:hypothetical protein